MNRYFHAFIALVILGSFAACTESPTPVDQPTLDAAQKLLLENVYVFDVFSGTMKGPKHILIEGDSIRSILEPGDRVESARRIDGRNGFALPGLFDCHTHLAHLTLEDHCEDTLRDFVSRGITQVRDVGGPVEVLQDMNRRIRDGGLQGPEIFYTGPMLEGNPLTWGHVNEKIPGFTLAIDTREDVDRILADLVQKGASMVKAFGKIDREIFTYLKERADHHGLRMVHDPGNPLFHTVSMADSIDLGVTSIEHGKAPWPIVLRDDLQEEHDTILAASGQSTPLGMAFAFKVSELDLESISEEKLQKLIEKMRGNEVYLCPTLEVFYKMEKTGPPVEVPPEALPTVKKIMAAMKNVSIHFTKKMALGRIKMLVGQDGIEPGGTFAEMEHLAECGLSPSEIIKGATLYPARWLGVEGRLGSISPGREANLLVLERNPLENIEHMRGAGLVIRKGEVAFRKE
jgi:imidazolonepropionase-like amidohydrolase